MKNAVIHGNSKLVYNNDDSVSKRSVGKWRIVIGDEAQVFEDWITDHKTLASAIKTATWNLELQEALGRGSKLKADIYWVGVDGPASIPSFTKVGWQNFAV